MSDLSDAQREFLSLADNVERVKGLSNIVKMFESKRDMKNGIDDLEDRGLIEKKSYGVWSITDKGSNSVFTEVRCENCGYVFSSREEAFNSSNMRCSHQNLVYRLEKFTG